MVRSISSIFLITFVISFFILTLFFNITLDEGQHFTLLASSFLKGKLYFLETDQFGLLDTVFYKGRYHWHLGPFPSVLLIPFVFTFERIGIFFRQGYLQFFLTVGIFFILYKVARLFKFSPRDSFLLSFAFCFASVYIPIAFNPTSWFFAHNVSVFFLLWAFYEFLTQKKYWLVY